MTKRQDKVGQHVDGEILQTHPQNDCRLNGTNVHSEHEPLGIASMIVLGIDYIPPDPDVVDPAPIDIFQGNCTAFLSITNIYLLLFKHSHYFYLIDSVLCSALVESTTFKNYGLFRPGDKIFILPHMDDWFVHVSMS